MELIGLVGVVGVCVVAVVAVVYGKSFSVRAIGPRTKGELVVDSGECHDPKN